MFRAARTDMRRLALANSGERLRRDGRTACSAGAARMRAPVGHRDRGSRREHDSDCSRDSGRSQ
jgi:hypothetical protein